MKSLLQILIFFFIVSNVFGQNRKVQVETQYFYNNRTQISTEKSYYKKGREKIYHGESKEYYRNGQLMSTRNYVNGQLEGKSIEYYESGQKLFEVNFSKGENVGLYKKFYENGEIMVEGEFINGNLEINRYGFPDGRYAIKKYWTDSSLLYEIYDKSGTIINKAETNMNFFVDSVKPDCNFKIEFKYPPMLVEKQLEGIVIIRLKIDNEGKLIEVYPLAGFHEEAIKQTVNAFRKNDCYMIRYENGIAVEYELTFAVNYTMF